MEVVAVSIYKLDVQRLVLNVHSDIAEEYPINALVHRCHGETNDIITILGFYQQISETAGVSRVNPELEPTTHPRLEIVNPRTGRVGCGRVYHVRSSGTYVRNRCGECRSGTVLCLFRSKRLHRELYRERSTAALESPERLGNNIDIDVCLARDVQR